MTELTRYRVHARHLDSHHARVIEEPSFEAAAVAYAEDFAHPAGDEPELSVIVQDIHTGHQRCFRFELDTGEVAPCG